MKKETIWYIFLGISVLLIINGMSHSSDPDKKTAQAAQGETAIGAGGVVAFVMKKSAAWVVPMLAIAGLVAALPMVIGQFKNLISPPTIPTWVWIAGFGLMFLMIVGRKK